VPDLYAALTAVEDRDVIDRVLDFMAALFWDAENGPGQVIPEDTVLAIADRLAIDLTAEWRKDAAGELTERWLNLRNKDGLLELACDSAVYAKGAISGQATLTKAAIVADLLKAARKIKPPAELLKPKRPRLTNH
jgi:hypothetical protein